jgi:hypothetical protein
MMPIVNQLRAVVGDEDRLLVAFDRGGAFPENMATLRDEGCEFVTYERAPCPALPESAFTSSATFGEGDDAETVRFVVARLNLKQGRGRVRRISVRGEDERQVNLLASSALEPERLIAIMRGRWSQEKGFKHGGERWGINHPVVTRPRPRRRRTER